MTRYPFPPWSSTSNANGIASALASAIRSADSGFLRLTLSGPTITLYSTTPGAAANWSVLASADDSTPPEPREPRDRRDVSA